MQPLHVRLSFNAAIPNLRSESRKRGSCHKVQPTFPYPQPSSQCIPQRDNLCATTTPQCDDRLVARRGLRVALQRTNTPTRCSRTANILHEVRTGTPKITQRWNATMERVAQTREAQRA
jgi:hypothetical protein